MQNFDASKIKEQANNLIAYDLMRKEEEMKRIKLKHFTYVIIASIVLVGGCLTVDAMTDNTITNAVKEAFNIKVNNKDYNAKCEKASNGMLKCNVDKSITDGTEVTFEVSEDQLKNVDITADKDSVEISVTEEITE